MKGKAWISSCERHDLEKPCKVTYSQEGDRMYRGETRHL